MSEQKKSRRRFLADILFLGGAAGAAGFIAKSKFGDQKPDWEGCELKAPEKPLPTDPEPVPSGAAPAHEPPEESLQSLGDVIQPQADGNMVLPEQLPQASPTPHLPSTRGRVNISRPLSPKPGEHL